MPEHRDAIRGHLQAVIDIMADACEMSELYYASTLDAKIADDTQHFINSVKNTQQCARHLLNKIDERKAHAN